MGGMRGLHQVSGALGVEEASVVYMLLLEHPVAHDNHGEDAGTGEKEPSDGEEGDIAPVFYLLL